MQTNIKISPATLSDISALGDSGRLVVAEIYRRVFDFVAPANGKGPIDATLDLDFLDYEAEVFIDAIDFMVGARATFTVRDGKTRFRAHPYYRRSNA